MMSQFITIIDVGAGLEIKPRLVEEKPHKEIQLELPLDEQRSSIEAFIEEAIKFDVFLDRMSACKPDQKAKASSRKGQGRKFYADRAVKALISYMPEIEKSPKSMSEAMFQLGVTKDDGTPIPPSTISDALRRIRKESE
jgi:hypothetical protein